MTESEIPNHLPGADAHSRGRFDLAREKHGIRRQLDEEFSEFYRASAQKLVGFLVNQGAGAAVAADIAQDTMMSAYRNWWRIREPRAWVHTVASRALARRIADVREEPVEPVPEPSSLLPDPHAVAEWEVRHDTQRLLAFLPPRQRQILAWTLNEFTPTEIANELGITPETVRANLMKARRAAATHFTTREEK